MADDDQVQDGHGAHGDVQAGVHLAQGEAQGPPVHQVHDGGGKHDQDGHRQVSNWHWGEVDVWDEVVCGVGDECDEDKNVSYERWHDDSGEDNSYQQVLL